VETNVYLKAKLEERTSLAAVVDNLQKGAAEKQRDLTDAERQTVDDHVKRMKFLDEEVARLVDVMEGNAKFQKIYGVAHEAEESVSAARKRDKERRDAENAARTEERMASWGTRFLNSEAFKSYDGHGSSRGFMIEGGFLGRAGLEERAAIMSDSFSDMNLPNPMLWSGPTEPPMRTPLFDVIGTVPTNAGSVEYFYWKLNDPSLMASLVPEGEQKPEAELEGELKSLPIHTYAWWKSVTRQALDDLPMIRGLIDTQLRRGIIRRLNTEAGTALTSNTDIASAPGGGGLVAEMRNAIAVIDDNGFSANAVLLNPMDWADLDNGLFPILQRDTSPPRGPQQNTNFWNLRPVAVSAIPQGTAYVGDFAEGMTFFDRQQTQLFLTDSHADFFIRNQLVLLAEARGLVAVTNAAAIVKCGGNGAGASPGSAGIEPASATTRAPRQRPAEQ